MKGGGDETTKRDDEQAKTRLEAALRQARSEVRVGFEAVQRADEGPASLERQPASIRRISEEALRMVRELGSERAHTISMSLDLLVMILIGGLGTLRGVLFGSLFLVVSPELMQLLVGLFNSGNTEVPGLRPFLFGASLILVLLFQPNGIDALVTQAGQWLSRCASAMRRR